MGPPLRLHDQYSSTYAVSNATRGNPVWVRHDKSEIPATKTSVKLGENSLGFYKTTTGSNYNARNAYGMTMTSNKDFINDIKADHFQIGDRRPRSAAATNYHYRSNTQ